MILFFILSFVCILISILLITNKNPVYSVLSLVFLFVDGSILLLLLGVDFLPFVFIVVYVGAVAVLFLFVVIILDIKLTSNNHNYKLVPLTFIISFLSFTFLNTLSYPYLTLNLKENTYCNEDSELADIFKNHYTDDFSSLSSLGQLLYTQYMLHFVIGGLVLLVALIGAIVLTSRSKTTSLKQKVFKQAERLAYVGKNKNA
jgi:NADH-quinone oxidoreductase subunit J